MNLASSWLVVLLYIVLSCALKASGRNATSFGALTARIPQASEDTWDNVVTQLVYLALINGVLSTGTFQLESYRRRSFVAAERTLHTARARAALALP